MPPPCRPLSLVAPLIAFLWLHPPSWAADGAPQADPPRPAGVAKAEPPPAAASRAAAPAADADGFAPLFNGRDLAGWVPVNVASAGRTDDTFTVRDGMICSTGKPTGVMRTDRMYENFVVELEWKHLTPGGNAGLFIWGDGVTAPGTPFARGIEVQILDEAYITQNPSLRGVATGQGDVFAIHGATLVPDRPHPKGWQRCLPGEDRTKPAGEWNHYRVECVDGVIKLAVNGKVVSGATKCNPRKGYLCLESEGAPAQFRNLRIKELPSTGAKPEETAAADPGYRPLYDGLTLTGWSQDPGHRGHWQPKDWTLAYDGKSQAKDKTLWTEKAYGDVELMVDYRWPAKPTAAGKPTSSPAGADAKPAGGSPKAAEADEAGSGGVLFRGSNKARVDLGGGPARRPAGQWTRLVITSRGDRLTVTVNGKPLADSAAQVGLPATGPIGLTTDRDAPIEFANLFVRELPPASPEPGPAPPTR